MNQESSGPATPAGTQRPPITTLNQRLYRVQREVAAQRSRNLQLQSELKAAEAELKLLRKEVASTSFKVGKLITGALRSPRLLLALPRNLWKLRAEALARRGAKR